MSYVDAVWVRDKDKILFSERVNGKRRIREEPAIYECYFADPNGTHLSTFREPCSVFRARTQKEFIKEVKAKRDTGTRIFESDHDVTFKSIARYYPDNQIPDLHISYFDIETKFIQGKGFAPPSDPFAPITAITIVNDWEDRCYTFVTPPDGMDYDTAERLLDGIPDLFIGSEKEILEGFLAVIEDADFITGWNSDGFDVPYIIGRLVQLFGEYKTSDLCLFGMKPSKREIERFGKTHITYELKGRIHIDYMDLYKKHNSKVQDSYKLDHIGEIEVQENKVHYEGTLDDLYNRDFRKFVEYAIQDTKLLQKIDKKKKFIQLANMIAHQNCVTLQKTMGSVAWLDQAMINHAHSMNLVVPDKIDREHPSDVTAAGAYVADPRKGIRKWVGSVDINSLYPSIIRSLNMDPSTLVGQIRLTETEALLWKKIETLNLKTKKGEIDWSSAWADMFGTVEFEYVRDKVPGKFVTVDFEQNGSINETVEFSASELHDMIYQPGSGLCLSGNGTIFRTDYDGIVASRLTSWYAKRASTKKLSGELKALASGKDINLPEDFVLLTAFVQLDEQYVMSISDCIKQGNADLLKAIMDDSGLVIDNQKIVSADMKKTKAKSEYWDVIQDINKRSLNASYGSLLNAGSKFYDHRLGQSITLSGRNVVRHMMSKIVELSTGAYTINSPLVVAGDTDSCYFSLYEGIIAEPNSALAQTMKDFDWTRENVTELYDSLATEMNKSFPEFMTRAFGCVDKYSKIIAAGRENIAEYSLFCAKKRYAMMVYDSEGIRQDVNGEPGKMKIMGLEIKRSDTSKEISQFLTDIMKLVLTGSSEDQIKQFVKEYRTRFKDMPAWLKGTPKTIKELSKYQFLISKAKGSKVNLPGHATASLNWNALRMLNADKESDEIEDGTRIGVCKLRNNAFGFTSIAYPLDQVDSLPNWFKTLPFDETAMEDGVLDKKIDNIFGDLGLNLTGAGAATEQAMTSFFAF